MLPRSMVSSSQVHGTWISGKKVDPFVITELNEGDTFQLGRSSRLYMLHWVPYSRAYGMEDPFVPAQLDAQDVDEETEDPTMFQKVTRAVVPHDGTFGGVSAVCCDHTGLILARQCRKLTA